MDNILSQVIMTDGEERPFGQYITVVTEECWFPSCIQGMMCDPENTINRQLNY